MKTEQDYLREAVELATGWMLGEDVDDDNGTYIEFADNTTWMINDMPMYLHDVPRIFIDALAAQLKSQVLAAGYDIQIDIQGSTFEAPGMWIEITDIQFSDADRYQYDARNGEAMNTIKAIVDSAVLSTESSDE